MKGPAPIQLCIGYYYHHGQCLLQGTNILQMDKGRLMDQVLVSGFPVMYNKLLNEVKPLLEFVNEYKCTIQILNHIGKGNE